MKIFIPGLASQMCDLIEPLWKNTTQCAEWFSYSKHQCEHKIWFWSKASYSIFSNLWRQSGCSMEYAFMTPDKWSGCQCMRFWNGARVDEQYHESIMQAHGELGKSQADLDRILMQICMSLLIMLFVNFIGNWMIDNLDIERARQMQHKAVAIYRKLQAAENQCNTGSKAKNQQNYTARVNKMQKLIDKLGVGERVAGHELLTPQGNFMNLMRWKDREEYLKFAVKGSMKAVENVSRFKECNPHDKRATIKRILDMGVGENKARIFTTIIVEEQPEVNEFLERDTTDSVEQQPTCEGRCRSLGPSNKTSRMQSSKDKTDKAAANKISNKAADRMSARSKQRAVSNTRRTYSI